jgi:hypothetical protein
MTTEQKLLKKIKKAVTKLKEIEEILEEWEVSKPVLYISEDTALMTSNDADIQYIKAKTKSPLA